MRKRSLPHGTRIRRMFSEQSSLMIYQGNRPQQRPSRVADFRCHHEQSETSRAEDKKAPEIITGTGGEPVGVTAIDENGNEKNYYEKDMKTEPPEEVSTLFKSDESAFAERNTDEAKQERLGDALSGSF